MPNKRVDVITFERRYVIHVELIPIHVRLQDAAHRTAVSLMLIGIL
jgi:hypothetical protein